MRSLDRWRTRPRIGWLHRFAKYLIVNITPYRIGLAVVCIPLFVYVVVEVTRPALIIDPFTVPKRFEEAGITSEVMANRVGDAITGIETSAKSTLARKDNLASAPSPEDSLDIEIPGTNVGLKTLIEIVRSVFRIYPKHVGGDVFTPFDDASKLPADPQKGSVLVTIYISAGTQRSPAITATIGGQNVDDVVQRIAELALEHVNPYLLGVYESDKGNNEKAVALAQQVTQDSRLKKPQRAAGFNLWGNVLLGQSKNDEAIGEYMEAVKLDPKGADPYNGWANALRNEGKREEAIAELIKAIEVSPKFAYPYNGWGNVLNDEGKNEEAIPKFVKAIELDPTFAYPYNGWGTSFISEGRNDEAILKYAKAIELDSSYADPYYNWGLALENEKRNEDAIPKFEKAIELNTRFGDAYNALGNALLAEGKNEDAIAKYVKAIELDPKNSHGYYNLGLAFLKEGKNEDAITKFTKAVALSPKFALPHNGWANALLSQRKYELAITQFTRSIELNPKDIPSYNGWGVALRAEGKNHEAEQKFAEAKALSSGQK